jgi:hypothetical protein
MTSLQIVSLPTAINVLCGSGQQEKRHSGNILFHQVVSQFTEEYSQATLKRVKMQITKNVFDVLTASGVRFLKKFSINKMWYLGKERWGETRFVIFFVFVFIALAALLPFLSGFGKAALCCAVTPKSGITVSSSILATSATISSNMTALPAVVVAAEFDTIVDKESYFGHPFESNTGNTGRGVSTISLLSSYSTIGEDNPTKLYGAAPFIHQPPSTILLFDNSKQTLQHQMSGAFFLACLKDDPTKNDDNARFAQGQDVMDDKELFDEPALGWLLMG